MISKKVNCVNVIHSLLPCAGVNVFFADKIFTSFSIKEDKFKNCRNIHESCEDSIIIPCAKVHNEEKEADL